TEEIVASAPPSVAGSVISADITGLQARAASRYERSDRDTIQLCPTACAVDVDITRGAARSHPLPCVSQAVCHTFNVCTPAIGRQSLLTALNEFGAQRLVSPQTPHRLGKGLRRARVHEQACVACLLA